jgi:hypothetical protein
MEMPCHFEGLYNNFRGLANKVKMAKVPPLVSVSSLGCMRLSMKISEDHALAPICSKNLDVICSFVRG